MNFLSLQPFVPSGKDFEKAKGFFTDLGFTQTWDAGGMAGFASGDCRFILQHFDDKAFAENFMLSVGVSDADAFYREVKEKGLPEKYGIRINAPVDQPYGREANVIDAAGVCWHFIQG